MNPKIFLIGLPGSGKTTFAKKLAIDLDRLFIDLDEEICNTSGTTIPELFNQKGEDAFRVIEQSELHTINDSKTNFILATGGGTPCFFDNMDFMNMNGVTIYIQPPINQIKERLHRDDTRPLMNKYSIDELYATRKPWYEKAQYRVTDYAELRQLFN